MKIIIISALVFMTVNAQNVWYVNRDATGGDTGRNWANAWTDFDSTDYWGAGNGINWKIIQPGDTIYVSGGTDSTIYSPNGAYGIRLGYGTSSKNTFASGYPVVVTPAYQTGHNGDVYISAYGTESPILAIMNLSNIKFIGFTIIDNRIGGSGMVQLGDNDAELRDSLIFFEDNHIIGKGITEVLYINGTKTTVRNCIIENLPNDLPNSQDAITMSGGNGGHTIDRNIIILRNGNNETDAHRDGIQLSNLGFNVPAGQRLTITISNNLLIDTNPEGTHWNNMLYNYGWTQSANARFVIYNNIFVNRKIRTGVGGLAIGRYYVGSYSEYNSIYFLNNTIISKGSSGSMFTGWAIDTLVMKNNILIKDSLAPNILNIENTTAYWNATYKDIDYNYYAEYAGISSPFAVAGGINKSWSQWQSDGFDVHGNSGNSTAVIFANKYGLNKEDYYTETGRDEGVDLSAEFPFLRYDILGNERTGSWDMGALEFGGSQSSNINLRSKIFLQGPFNTNLMNTNLSQNGLLPNTQPFNTAPWNYNGSESLSSGSSSSFVDWVLVELRSSSNPTQVVSRKAAILKNDGTLLNSDGSIGVPFSNVQEGSYYVAVFHRNHLAVMSANPVQLSANSQIYDFTNGMDKAYGTNPMANLGNGIFGMYTGDGNSNGGITIADRNEVWLPQNGTLGYLNGDFNLDGGVTIHDVNLYWNINNGTMTQVP
ncbi:MAG: hypothetical protein IPI19_07825 [Ignavibacteriales bacterium]|nr:hypothetical protein [Ignavibacteriales bacterium]